MLKIKTNIFTICILALFTTTCFAGGGRQVDFDLEYTPNQNANNASTAPATTSKEPPQRKSANKSSSSQPIINHIINNTGIQSILNNSEVQQILDCNNSSNLKSLHATSAQLNTKYTQCEPTDKTSCEPGFCYVPPDTSHARCDKCANGDECTPSTPLDKRATKYFWDSTTSSCLIKECIDDYVTDIAHKKCVTGKKQLKELNQLDKDYVKDFEQLLDAYDKVAKKYIENCLKDGGTIEEWECHE